MGDRKTIAVIAAVALLLTAEISALRLNARSTDVQTTQVDIFSRNDHLLISRAIAAGEHTAIVLVAVKPGYETATRTEIAALGGKVTYEAAELGYIEARMPIDALSDLHSNDITVANIQALDQFGPSLEQVRSQTTGVTEAAPLPVFTPPPGLSQSNVYSGTKDVGQPVFLAQHPAYDGRGVVVGILERADLFSPFLQQGKDLAGHRAPKFLDVHMLVTPHTPTLLGGKNNEEVGWVDMHQEIIVKNHQFTYHGHVFGAPANGRYRVGSFRIDYSVYTRKWYQNVVHPTGTAYEKAGSFTVLWNQSTGTVWVNTNQNGSLADDTPMHDFGRDHDVGSIPVAVNWDVYGEAYPRGMRIPTHYPFIIKIDSADDFVWIGLMTSSHGEGVTTSIAGSRFFGRYDGMAPGARFLITYGDNGYSTDIEEMIDTARSGVDAISCQSGSDFAANQGDNVWNVILDRLVDYYKIPIACGASNAGPTIDSTLTPSDSNKVFAVGGYLAKDRLRADEGVIVSSEDSIAIYSGRGPRADGGFFPTFLAPTEALVGGPTTEPPQTIALTRQLPMGYTVFGGTSQATPMATGVIALLISAAKQQHIPYDPDRLRVALMSTARFLPHYLALDQGAGLLDVNAAWQALQKLATVNPISDTSNQPGIYERAGWHAGDIGERRLNFMFTSRRVLPESLPIRWIGNDGTFSSASSLSVGSSGATIRLTIHPVTSGVHSAILRIDDPSTGLMITERMCTIITSEKLDAYNEYTIERHVTVEHPGYRRFFVDVPPNTEVLAVHVFASASSYASVINPVTASMLVEVRGPVGDWLRQEGNGVNYPWAHNGRVWQHAYPHPKPGVYEITIKDVNPSTFYADPKQQTPLPPAQFTLRITAFSAHANVIAAELPLSGKLQITNTMASFHVHGLETALGTERTAEVTVDRHHPRRIFTINVPAGTTGVRAQIGIPSSKEADIDVYLFSCVDDKESVQETAAVSAALVQGKCTFRGAGNAWSGGVASVAFPQNAQDLTGKLPVGLWVTVVDTYRLPSYPVRISYTDTVINRKYGFMRILGQERYIHSGQSWEQPYTIARGAMVPAGRRLVALPGIAAAEGDTMWANITGRSWEQMANSHAAIQYNYDSLFTQVLPLPQ